MEKKEFNKFEKARIKRAAQNVNQYVNKKKKLVEKIEECNKEIQVLQNLIDLSDAPVKLITGGYGVEELVRRVITPTDKVDKNGRVITVTTYEFIYPDTIVPPVIEVPDTEDTNSDNTNIELKENNL